MRARPSQQPVPSKSYHLAPLKVEIMSDCYTKGDLPSGIKLISETTSNNFSEVDVGGICSIVHVMVGFVLCGLSA